MISTQLWLKTLEKKSLEEENLLLFLCLFFCQTEFEWFAKQASSSFRPFTTRKDDDGQNRETSFGLFTYFTEQRCHENSKMVNVAFQKVNHQQVDMPGNTANCRKSPLVVGRIRGNPRIDLVLDAPIKRGMGQSRMTPTFTSVYWWASQLPPKECADFIYWTHLII